MLNPRAERNKVNKLERFLNKRIKAKGTITKFGYSQKEQRQTILMHEIYLEDPNTRLCDHCWVSIAKYPAHVKKGDTVSFMATIKRYKRDYKGTNKSFNDTIGMFDAGDFEVLSSIND